MSRRTWTVLTVLGGIAILVFFISNRPDESASLDTEPEVMANRTSQVEAKQRDFEIVVVLDAAVEQPTPVTIGTSGDVTAWDVEDGDAVDEGQVLGRRSENSDDESLLAASRAVEDAQRALDRSKADLTTARQPVATDPGPPDEDGEDSAGTSQQVDVAQVEAERAVEDAQLALRRAQADYQALVDSEAEGVGDVVAPANGVFKLSTNPESPSSIQPDGFDIVAPLSPESAYRLGETIGDEATVLFESLGLPRFDCSGLELSASTGEVSSDDGSSSSATSQVLRCRAPGSEPLVVGLEGVLAVSGESIPNALVVPVTAIGRSSSGEFVVQKQVSGESEEVMVEIGPSDGKDVVITEGLQPGDKVLEFHDPEDGFDAIPNKE